MAMLKAVTAACLLACVAIAGAETNATAGEAATLKAEEEASALRRQQANLNSSKLTQAAVARDAVLPANAMRCLGWRQTANCEPTGMREASKDALCEEQIEEGWSGYCACVPRNLTGMIPEAQVSHIAAVPCGHPIFTCHAACEHPDEINAIIDADLKDGGGKFAPHGAMDEVDLEVVSGHMVQVTKRHLFKSHENGHALRRHRNPGDGRALLALMLLFLLMLGAQSLLFYWKKAHYASYQKVTLGGLWFFPVAVACASHSWRFLAIDSLFSAVCAYIIFLSTRRPLGESTPRYTYAFFLAAYKVCYSIGYGGYCVIMLEFFGLRELLFLPVWIPQAGSMFLFYGLYFGLLGRDCAEMCSDSIASVMGFSNKRKKLDGVSCHHVDLPANTCAVCEGLLIDPIQPDSGEKIIKLGCGHSYHELCIRGWTLIGKKDTCPYCNERVQLRQTFTNPWDTTSILYAQLLDAIRYLIVWNPVILVATQLVLYIVGFK